MQRPCLLLWVLLLAVWATAPTLAEGPSSPNFSADVEPILRKLCFDCHGDGADEGGVQFDAADSVEALVADRPLWGRVWDNVLTETMPPADVPQPTDTERRTLSRWIGQTVFQISDAAPDPGRVTIRRLNRDEYRYSVLDLLGVDFDVADHFPADDTGYGFDTIGDVLTLPPTLMDKYFSAAEQIADQIVDDAARPAADRSKVYKYVFHAGPPPTDEEGQIEYAREIFRRIATRAFRRPVDEPTIERLLRVGRKSMEQGTTFEEAVGQSIVAILVSPRFLYRAEFQPRPEDPDAIHPLDDYALAARLSYFLWSSIPDQELRDLAAQGRLREELPAQLSRMLKSPKSLRMVRRFVGQWLLVANVEGIHKINEFRDVLRHLRPLMRRETEMLFAHVMRQNLPAIDLITADYTFVNHRLAKFYGISGVQGDKMRRVQLSDDGRRGGVLTHASVLLVTSNPDRTSPVKRGQFVLSNILGAPSPPPPPNVPPLKEATVGLRSPATLRAQLALHRADPACAQCHDRMDPLGLGLENFDAIGRWRDKDHGQPIDASAQLASGEQFTGIVELREILAGKKRLFYRCLTQKLMTYALGRGIDYTDTPAIEKIVDRVLANDGQFHVMLLGIIESPQFQLRRGSDPRID